MKIRILAIVLTLFMCVGVCGCIPLPLETETPIPEKTTLQETTPSTTPTPTVSVSTPLLYKVTNENGNSVWLFGSIHVGRKDYFPLPDYVLNAFDNSEGLAVEFDIITFENDLKTQMNALGKLVYKDGSTVKNHVSKELYDQASAILKENGLYNAMLGYYNASFWSMYIDNCTMMQLGINSELGVDLHLTKRANTKGIKIYEIESAEFQYSMMSEFSEELQEYLLASSVNTYNDLENAKDDYKTLMDLWFEGDEKKLWDYLSASPEFKNEEEELPLYTEYNNAMMTERNENMTEFVKKALEEGENLFVCVGAAHIVGDGAIVDNLRNEGYTVEIVKN